MCLTLCGLCTGHEGGHSGFCEFDLFLPCVNVRQEKFLVKDEGQVIPSPGVSKIHNPPSPLCCENSGGITTANPVLPEPASPDTPVVSTPPPAPTAMDNASQEPEDEIEITPYHTSTLPVAKVHTMATNLLNGWQGSLIS